MEQLYYLAAFMGAISGVVYCTAQLARLHNLGKRRHTPTPED
jgi:hypothetical protein